MQSLEREQKVLKIKEVKPFEAKAHGVQTVETVVSVDPDSVIAAQPAVPQHTAEQLKNQRLLIRELKHDARPGEGLKRFGINATIFAAATGVDIAESHLIDKIMRGTLERKVEEKKLAEDNYTVAMFEKDVADKKPGLAETFEAEKARLHDLTQRQQGKQWAADLIEEWATDGAYASVANAWARNMTGIDGTKYVSETAAFLSDWGNIISQVFMADKLWGKTVIEKRGVHDITVPKKWHGIKLAYRSMDLVNPVNVEAAFRMLEEIPVFGDGVSLVHNWTDKFLESTLGRLGNTVASKGVMGYHMGKNLKLVKLV